MRRPSLVVKEEVTTWLKEQDDKVINYALASFYWSKHQQLTAQQRARATQGRALAHGTQTQSRSRTHRINRSAPALLALKQLSSSLATLPQTRGRLRSEQQRQEALKRAYDVIDQIDHDDLKWSLYGCLERQLKEYKRKTKFKADGHKIYETDLSFLQWIEERNNAHHVLNGLLEALRERPEDEKAHGDLIKHLDQLIYYAFVLDRPLKALINDDGVYQTLTQALEGANSSIEELHAVVVARQQSAQAYSWVKLFSEHIKLEQRGNHSANASESDENLGVHEHFDVVKSKEEEGKTEAQLEHESLTMTPIEWVLAETVKEVIDDEALPQQLFLTEKHRGHQANYQLWLETLRAHLTKVEAPLLKAHQWSFDVKSYSVKSFQEHVGHKPLGRLRDHVTTHVEELITQMLNELSARDELGAATATAWSRWCEQLEALKADAVRAQTAERLFIKLNLNDLKTTGKLSIALRISLEHEALCEAHVDCDHEVTHPTTALDQPALRRLCYLSSVITLINSVTRLRKGSTRVKEDATS